MKTILNIALESIKIILVFDEWLNWIDRSWFSNDGLILLSAVIRLMLWDDVIGTSVIFFSLSWFSEQLSLKWGIQIEIVINDTKVIHRRNTLVFSLNKIPMTWHQSSEIKTDICSQCLSYANYIDCIYKLHVFRFFRFK